MLSYMIVLAGGVALGILLATRLAQPLERSYLSVTELLLSEGLTRDVNPA